MNWDNFINQIVDMGIAAAKRDYTRPDQKALLDGSIAGFEACRDKSVTELARILVDLRGPGGVYQSDIFYYRGFNNEVTWVCNVVSAALYNQGLPTIIPPTVRGMQTAAKILGVKGQ